MLRKSICKGMILEISVSVSVYIATSLSLYAVSVCRFAISVRHFNVMLRNSATSRNRLRNVSMRLKPPGGLSKMKPRGIQLRNHSNVSKVALIKLGDVAELRTSEQ